MNTVLDRELIEILGDNHQATSADTPLRDDAFVKSDAPNMERIEHHFHAIIKHRIGFAPAHHTQRHKHRKTNHRTQQQRICPQLHHKRNHNL